MENIPHPYALEKKLLKYCLICKRKTKHFVIPVKPLRYIAGTSAYCLCCEHCNALEGFDDLDLDEMSDEDTPND